MIYDVAVLVDEGSSATQRFSIEVEADSEKEAHNWALSPKQAQMAQVDYRRHGA